MSTPPSARPFLTSRLSAAPTIRESWPTLTGRPAKRWRKFWACWRASRVVGATIAVCLPLIAVAKAARSATSVLPKPTSPHTSRSIGRPAARSSSVASLAPALTNATAPPPQPVHWSAGGQVVQRRLNRARLVRRFVVGKAGAKFVVQAFWGSEAGRRMRHALRSDANDFPRHLAHALL